MTIDNTFLLLFLVFFLIKNLSLLVFCSWFLSTFADRASSVLTKCVQKKRNGKSPIKSSHLPCFKKTKNIEMKSKIIVSSESHLPYFTAPFVSARDFAVWRTFTFGFRLIFSDLQIVVSFIVIATYIGSWVLLSSQMDVKFKLLYFALLSKHKNAFFWILNQVSRK